MDRPPLTLLDVREEWEHHYVRFPHSLLIPLSRLPENMGEIPRDLPVIVYCHTGVRSILACYFLCQNGYKNVLNLDGGIDAYAQRVDQRLPRYRLGLGRRPPENFPQTKSRKDPGRPENEWGSGMREGCPQ